MEQVWMVTLVQLLFGTLLIYKKLLLKREHIFMAGILSIGCFHMLLKVCFLWLTPGNHEYPLVVMPFCFSYAPLIYCYASSVLKQQLPARRQVQLHLLPFILLLLGSLVLVVYHSYAGQSVKPVVEMLRYSIAPYQWAYAGAMLWLLARNGQRGVPVSSTHRALVWILAVILIVQAPLVLIGQLQVFVNWLSPVFIPSYYWLLLLVFLVLLYYYIREPQVVAVTAMTNTLEEKEKYQKSGLDMGYLEACYTKLQDCMASTQLYKENGLTLNDLADKLNLPRHHLSQALNQQSGKNFFQYLNEWRVQEICRLMLKEENTDNFLQLAYECGFNSKSTFNQNFKKITGKTPSEFYACNTPKEREPVD